MATEYKLPYTGSEINEKLGKIDGIEAEVNQLSSEVIQLNSFNTVRTINHKGYNTVAPENTLPAYILSKKKGYKYVECDVSFTSDGIAVLLHDDTIDRTSSGSGKISSLTYAEASQYDYGSWVSSDFAGTGLPTFEDFILLCKRIGLYPYIELKSNGAYTKTQIQTLVDIVKVYGMEGKVSWISFSSAYLNYVKEVDTKARLGYISWDSPTNSMISLAQSLQTSENEVFLDIWYGSVNDNGVALCSTANIPLEVYTCNSSTWVNSMNPYVTGVTTDDLDVNNILLTKGMTTTTTGIGGDGASLYYTVVNNLTNVVNSNTASVVKRNMPYNASIASVEGYELYSVTITMNGIDVTASVYADGIINITSATGNIVITAIANEDVELTEPIVNLALTSANDNVIMNNGTGGAAYNATISTVEGEGSFIVNNNGLTLYNRAWATINYAFSPNNSFAICIKGIMQQLSNKTYQRFARNEKDALCIFYDINTDHYNIKLANSENGTTLEISDSNINKTWNGVNFTSTYVDFKKEHTWIFVGNANTNLIYAYLDGILIATQTLTELATSSLYTIGNGDTSVYLQFGQINVSEFKIWDRAITSSEIQELSDGNNNPDSTLTISEQWEKNGSADITFELVQGRLTPTEGKPYNSYQTTRVSYCGMDLVVSEGDVISISTSNNNNFQWGVRCITQAGVDSIAAGKALVESGEAANIMDSGWKTSDITIPANVVRIWFTFAKRNATNDSISPADLGTVIISKKT